jgi:hypothetical protein
MGTVRRISAESTGRVISRYGKHAIPRIEKDIIMSDELMTEPEAADYCDLDFKYFRNLRRTGYGPGYVRPSPHTPLYFRATLDSWKSSWPKITPSTTEQKATQKI